MVRSRLKRSISLGFGGANGLLEMEEGRCSAWTCRWMAGGGCSHSWKAPAGLFLAHIRPLKRPLRPLHAGFSAPTQKGLVRERGLPGASSSHTPTLSQSLGRSVVLQVQEAGRGVMDQMNQRSGCKRQPHLPIPGLPCSRCLLPESALRPPASPLPLIPAPSSVHKPSLPSFFSLPLCSSPGWVSEPMGSLETDPDLFWKASMTEGTTATSCHGAWTQGKYGVKKELLDSERDLSPLPACLINQASLQLYGFLSLTGDSMNVQPCNWQLAFTDVY